MTISVDNLLVDMQRMADRLADEIRECDRLREENTVLRGDISEMRAANKRLRERYVDATARPDHVIACPSCSAVLCYRCGIYEERLNQYTAGGGDKSWWRRVTRDYQRHKEDDHVAPHGMEASQ